jgi:hypothetical protein
MDRAWARRNTCHWSSRADGGGIVGRAGSCGSCPRRSGVPGGAARPGGGPRPKSGSRWRGGRSARRVRPGAVAVLVSGAGSTSWSPCGGASAAAFPGSRGAGATLWAAAGTAPRARPGQPTRAAAWGSPGAVRRPPGAGPVSRHPSTPTTGPAAPARTALRQRTGRSGEPVRWPIIAGPNWWPSSGCTTGDGGPAAAATCG